MEINKIYNMDCNVGLEEMIKGGVRADIVLSSPPYNIVRPNSTDRGYDLYKDGMTNEEYAQWNCELFNKFDKILNKDGCVLWNMSYGCENTECMSITIAEIIKNTNFTLADIIVWRKNCATPNNVSKNKLTRICEFVYVFCRRSEFMTFDTNKRAIKERTTGQLIYENVFNIVEAKNNDEHCELNMATFSTELCYKLMNIYAKQNATILDPFMGTGTTALACVKTNRNYIGFELSKAQCDWAEKRIEGARNQTSLFD